MGETIVWKLGREHQALMESVGGPNRLVKSLYVLGASVSQAGCNTVPWARWPKATEVYSLTIVEARDLKSRCWLPLFSLLASAQLNWLLTKSSHKTFRVKWFLDKKQKQSCSISSCIRKKTGHKIRYSSKDEMAGWHHQHNGYEFEQALGDTEGQGSLVCCMQSLGSQRVGHDFASEQQLQEKTLENQTRSIRSLVYKVAHIFAASRSLAS